MPMREYNFDGLVGPTHNYAGLSPGNLASTAHGGSVGNPRAALLQGLAKMGFVAGLGVGQALLPPAPRPDVAALRQLGFSGSDARVVERALQHDPQLLRLCSSASSMWTANAATVAPSSDTGDARVHFTPANLVSMFHRSLEAPFTTRVLRQLFADSSRFVVHDALPASPQFSDEGAANHTRLFGSSSVVHLLAWGRRAWGDGAAPKRFPARQSYEASAAVARLHELPAQAQLLWPQAADGIDAGAFHTDVLAVGNGAFFMLHEAAFSSGAELIAELRRRLGDELIVCQASEAELPVSDAVAAYPFNSQLLGLPGGGMAVIAPGEARENSHAARFLERVLDENNPVQAVHYLDVNASMHNGGGPACLRLRVPLTDEEQRSVGGRVFLDDTLYADLVAWGERHYRDRLSLHDLGDPALLVEVRTALDELSSLLQLGSVYDFQRTGPALTPLAESAGSKRG